MRKNAQIESSSDDSHSVGETARLLGLSIPTVKRMAEAGTLETFRTPGGHLRVMAESVKAIKEQRHSTSRTGRGSSPVIQNRRERVEELALEAQEHRAKREIERLKREDQEEAERLRAEAQAREDEAAQRREEIALERERLECEKAEDRRRLQRERTEEQARIEAERRLTAFRQRWCAVAPQIMEKSARLTWLTAGQRKEITEALEAEIERRQPADEPRMGEILARSVAALVEPLIVERNAQERRQRLTAEALRSLPHSATDADRVKATAAVREALRQFDSFADVCEMRVAAQEAVQPVQQAIERRDLEARLLRSTVWQLPWGKNEQDEARVRRECSEILAELPVDVSEAEAKEALRATIDEARTEIEQRQAEKERQARKAQLLADAVSEVIPYMGELERKGEITRNDYWDGELTEHLRTAIRRGLQSELTGDESTKEVRELAREMLDRELDQ